VFAGLQFNSLKSLHNSLLRTELRASLLLKLLILFQRALKTNSMYISWSFKHLLDI